MNTNSRFTRQILVVLTLSLVGGCEFHCSVGGVDREVIGPLTTEPTAGSLPDNADVVTMESEAFWVVWTDPDVTEGDIVLVRVTGVQVSGVPDNTELARNQREVQAGEDGGYFGWPRPETGWAPGLYRVEITRDTVQIGAVEFEIAPPQPTETP